MAASQIMVPASLTSLGDYRAQRFNALGNDEMILSVTGYARNGFISGQFRMRIIESRADVTSHVAWLIRTSLTDPNQPLTMHAHFVPEV